jgi:hypothetical protein
LDFLNEQNVEKYRTQRRAVGPAYSEAAMKDLEPLIDAILEKDIGIMRERSGQPVDLDLFFNMIGSGKCFFLETKVPVVLENSLTTC